MKIIDKINETFKLRDTKKVPDNHVTFEWNQIDEFIFVGTNQCCQMHYDKEMIEKGVTCDVSMEGERLDSPEGAEILLWLPTIDHTAPTLENLEVGAVSIIQMVEQKRGVYIHCKNGHGRGPTMAAAYFIYQGASTDEAIDMIQVARAEAHIEPVQVDALREFEKLARK